MNLTEVISKKTYRNRKTEQIPVFVFPDMYGSEEGDFWDWLDFDEEDRIPLDEFEYGPIVLQLLNPGAYRDAPTQFVTTTARRGFGSGRAVVYVVDDINEGEAIHVSTPLDRIVNYLRKHAEQATYEVPIDKEKYPNI